MNKILIKTFCAIMLPFAMIACTEANYGDVNLTRITKSDLNPAFTVVPVVANKYTLTPTSNKNVISSQWDLGIGSFAKFNPGDTLFLPDAGSYIIKRYVVGAGGITSDTISQTITVATSDPKSGNLLLGSKFVTPADLAKWTIGGTGTPAGGVWTYTPGTATTSGKETLTASGYAGNGIYQAVNVTAGKKYHIDMLISSTTGLSDSWLEVYCDYTNPTTVTGDYSVGGKRYSVSTWDNAAAKSPFSGKISKLMLGKATDNVGTFTATTTGTVYLVIRGGGNDMKAGISITNIEFRGI
jgi:hypothetical protein